MDEQKIIENLKKEIKSKIGRSLDSPSDFDYLSMQIKISLHEYISPTTLKRFFNYIACDVKPRVSTMSLLARFVGAAGWQDYCNDFISDSSAKEQGRAGESVIKTENRKETGIPAEDDSCKIYTDIKLILASDTGCCNIYKAKKFNRWHALKSLKQEYSSNKACAQMLYNEFSNVYLKTHPNVIRSVGYEHVAGIGECIVMEYIEGENIVDYVKSNSLSPKQVWPLVKELAVAIDYIHENGIIHNNIKRENVIVTYDGEHVKLMDFAKSTDNFYVRHKELPDIASFIELIKEINAAMPVGFAKISLLSKKYEEVKIQKDSITAQEIADLLNVKKSYITEIFIFAVVFSALLSSFITYKSVKDNTCNKYVYDEALAAEHLGNISSTIMIYDNIAQIVMEHAKAECFRVFNEIDTIPSARDKFIALSKAHRQLLYNKNAYPTLVLDEYLPKNCPEYNLYRSSLVQLVEDIYSQLVNDKRDSLRKAF